MASPGKRLLAVPATNCSRRSIRSQPTVFEAALERAGEWTGELTHTTRDGRRILVESRHVLVREADGRRLVLETNRDITERKQADEAVRRAQAELAHVARVTTLGEMAASIAHEVDQPLSGVVINANACVRFLTGAPPNLEEVHDGLQAIARDGRRASEVIARIRALARRAPTEKEPVDINEVIREVVALAGGRSAADTRETPDRAGRGSPACARRPRSTAAGGAQPAPERAGSHERRRGPPARDSSSARNERRPIASVSRCGTREPASTRSSRAACSRRSTRRSAVVWGWASRSAAPLSSSTADDLGRAE